MEFHNHRAENAHNELAADEVRRGQGGRGRGRRPGGRGPGGRGGGRGPGGRGHGGRGRERARRGAVAEGVLLLLAEQPRHGYELIAELEERSEGRWRPSPGSMYPALSRLEEKGFIAGVVEDDGKRRYDLTDAGRERVALQDPDAPAPWAEEATGSSSPLRGAVAEIVGQARQIGRFGTDAQRDAAVAVLKRAKSELYLVLADQTEQDS